MWMMKRTINDISNLRDQAQLPCAQDLEQALPLGLQIDSDKSGCLETLCHIIRPLCNKMAMLIVIRELYKTYVV